MLQYLQYEDRHTRVYAIIEHSPGSVRQLSSDLPDEESQCYHVDQKVPSPSCGSHDTASVHGSVRRYHECAPRLKWPRADIINHQIFAAQLSSQSPYVHTRLQNVRLKNLSFLAKSKKSVFLPVFLRKPNSFRGPGGFDSAGE